MKVGIIRCQLTEDMCPPPPIGYPCPHFAAIKAAVEAKIGPDVKIIDWTH